MPIPQQLRGRLLFIEQVT